MLLTSERFKSGHSIESVPLGALPWWLLLVICVWSL